MAPYDSDCDSLETNQVFNAFYAGNVSLTNTYLENNKNFKEFFENVKQRNPLLYACITNDMETIKEILSTDTTLMNECLLTVLFNRIFFIIY